MRFAYSTINWGTTPDLESAFGEIREAGWGAVELFVHQLDWLGTPDHLRSALGALEVATNFGVVEVPTNKDQLTKLENQIDYAALLGAEAIGLVGGTRLRWRPRGASVPRRGGLAAFDFPPGTVLFTEMSKKKRASLHDLLTSRSGVYHASVYDIDRDRPARGSHPPGAHFYYNNWDFNALGTIFERVTGEGLFAAFAEQVAMPLGMEDFAITDLRFEHGPESIHPVYKMRLSARDLVRIGRLYLQNGMWEGRQVVPETWVRESIRPQVDLGGGRGYGFLWWSAAAHAPGDRLHADVPLYYASGLGGQYIIVLPDHDLVVVHRSARVDHGIDHGRMGEILNVILQAMPGF